MMNRPSKVIIKKLPTGVAGLDDILGGGLPEFSFNLIAGTPGAGKTTLAHQFIFANATAESPALYFTILGEPSLKMLRYQQQYTFFDAAKLNTAVRFINLSEVLKTRGLRGILEAITEEVHQGSPRIVVVDSFRTAMRKAGDNEMEVQSFVQELGLLLSSWEATTFLLGEYTESEIRDNPVFTVADGLLWLHQMVEGNSVVRKLQVKKLRGQQSVPGLHTFRITDAGVEAFSRTLGLGDRTGRSLRVGKRLSTGISALDEMLGGGIPEGDNVLVTGSSGTGKSLIGMQFMSAGFEAGEPGIVVVFEDRPEEYISRAGTFGVDLTSSSANKLLNVLYLRPLDLSVDEAMHEILAAVRRTKAKRLVFDSLPGFEIALAPGFRDNFRESFYRVVVALSGRGVTILSTLEMEEAFTEFPSSRHSISFLVDDLIRLRYIEIDSQLRKILTIVKMRSGAHSNDIREYQITSSGLVIGERLPAFSGLLTGIPTRQPETS